MRTHVIASLACLGMAGFVHGQDAVQWTETEGGNGHWYARAEFANQDYEGLISYAQSLGGNLASITSAEENIFLSGISADLPDSTLLGARDENPSPDICEWTWADGSVWNYTNWAADQPNSCGGEEYVTFYSVASESREWHDMGLNNGSIRWFLIEWSADCNNDGIVDYGQILDGTFSDDNGNGIPDCCDDNSCMPAYHWTTEDGGDGRWYQPVVVTGTWTDARIMAESRGGTLPSVTSAEKTIMLNDLMAPGHGRMSGE